MYHVGLYNTNAESTTARQSPSFMWGLRNGSTCVSAQMGVGDSSSDGAGGHWSCDFPFTGSANTPQANTYKPSTFGYTPTINAWHHVCVPRSAAAGRRGAGGTPTSSLAVVWQRAARLRPPLAPRS